MRKSKPFKFKTIKTYPLLTPLLKWLSNVPFVLTLKILNLRYGRGNVPSPVLTKYCGKYLKVDDGEHALILLSSTVHDACVKFNIEFSESKLVLRLSKVLRNENITHADLRWVEDIVNHNDLRRNLIQCFIGMGDLTATKFQFFDNPQNEAWLSEVDKITQWLARR
jgi:hypothetical protein